MIFDDRCRAPSPLFAPSVGVVCFVLISLIFRATTLLRFVPVCIRFAATETEIFFAWMQRTMPTARALPYGIPGDRGFHTMSSTVCGGKGGGGLPAQIGSVLRRIALPYCNQINCLVEELSLESAGCGCSTSAVVPVMWCVHLLATPLRTLCLRKHQSGKLHRAGRPSVSEVTPSTNDTQDVSPNPGEVARSQIFSHNRSW